MADLFTGRVPRSDPSGQTVLLEAAHGPGAWNEKQGLFGLECDFEGSAGD